METDISTVCKLLLSLFCLCMLSSPSISINPPLSSCLPHFSGLPHHQDPLPHTLSLISLVHQLISTIPLASMWFLPWAKVILLRLYWDLTLVINLVAMRWQVLKRTVIISWDNGFSWKYCTVSGSICRITTIALEKQWLLLARKVEGDTEVKLLRFSNP